MGTDFFDEDLAQANDLRKENIEEEDGVPVRPISEASLSRMAKQKQELSNQVAGAAQEIELLRKKHEELEKEKGDLEELTGKQEEYEHGKRDIMNKLDRSIILIEKEEVQATNMAGLLSETRARFRDTLSELRKIDEATWSDETFHAELNRAMVLVENARMDYNKALAKIDAASWHKSAAEKTQPPMLEEVGRKPGLGFGYWLKVGFAVSLPLIMFLVILFVAYLIITSGLV